MSGKSSLVRAGLIPDLEEKQPETWLFRSMRPGTKPREALAEALDRGENAGGFGPEDVETMLAAYRRERLLLVVDQFEELFTQSEEGARAAFVKDLRALRQADHCAIVMTMRADYYPDLMRSELWERDRA